METVEITMVVKVSYANCVEGDEAALASSMLDAIQFAVDDGYFTEDTVAELSWLKAETFRGHDARYGAAVRIGSALEIDLEGLE